MKFNSYVNKGVELLNSEAVDGLWQSEATPAYPAARMLHFLRILSGAFGRCVQSRLNSLNVWTSSFSQVSKHIREGHKVCERWNEITLDLTDVQWRSTEHLGRKLSSQTSTLVTF